VVAAQELGCRDWQIRLMETLERREIRLAELVHRLGRR